MLDHYEIQATQKPDLQSTFLPSSTPSEERDRCSWFDVMFALMARDTTALGEQRMISESLTLLMQYPYIPARLITLPLSVGQGLPLQVLPMTLLSQPTFWSAIGIPLRPTLQVTVTTPFKVPAPDQSSCFNHSLPPVPP